MSANAPKTATQQSIPERERDLENEQRAVTDQLREHQDPMVRMLVHISDRQLASSEILREVRDLTKAAVAAAHEAIALAREAQQTAAETRARQDSLDARFPVNGHSAHTDA